MNETLAYTQFAGPADLFERLVSSSPNGIIVNDLHGQILFANEPAITMLGYRPEELIGRPVQTIYADPQQASQVKRELHRQGDSLSQEVTLRSKRGELIPIRLKLTWLRDTQGTPTGFAGYFEDLRVIQAARERLDLLLEQNRATEEWLRISYEASNALVSSMEPEQLLQNIGRRAHQVSGADSVQLLLVDALRQVQNPVAIGDVDLRPGATIRPGGLTMQAICTGRPQYVEDAGREQERVSPDFIRRGVKAALGLPVGIEGQHIGVLWLFYRQPRHFSAQEIEALQLFANQAAVAYESACRLKELELMREAAESLAAATTLHEVARQTVDSTLAVLQADSVVLWLYDERRRKFIFDGTVAAGVPAALWPRFLEAEPAPGSIAYTILEKGWISVPEMENPPEALGGRARELLGELGVRSFQGICLRVGAEKQGVLYVNYNRMRSFSEQDREISRSLANQAALALKKARLLHRVRGAQATARVLAGVATQLSQELGETLNQVVKGMVDVLECDAATLYLYDQDRNRLASPATMWGVWYPERTVRRSGYLDDSSVVMAILQRDEPYIADDVADDPLLGQSPFARDEGIVSCIALPLQAGRGRVGVMFINYREPHRFTGDELDNIDLFANQAAIAIENAQLYDRVQEQLHALQALDEAAHAVTASLDLDTTLTAIAEQACKLAGVFGKDARFGMLAMLRGNKLYFGATYPAEHLPQLREKVGAISISRPGPVGVCGRAVLDDRPVLVPDVHLFDDYILYDPQTRSELAVPIRSGRRIIGVINVEHPDTYAFDQQDVQALETLAEYAAIAIQNAQLYNWLETVDRISSEAANTLNISRLLRSVCQRLEQHVRAEIIASIRLYDKEQNVLVFKPEWHDSLFNRIDIAGEIGRTTQPLDMGIGGYVARHRRAVNVGDVTAPEAFPKALRLISSTRAELCVPICYGTDRELVGVLHVQSSEKFAFDDNDQRFLEMLADQLAVAIRKAQEYEDLQATKGLVGSRTALAWMGMASNAWRHSIENDAMSIRNHAGLLRGQLQGVLPASSREQQQLEERLDHIVRLANKILQRPITPPLSPEDGLEPVVLNDLLRERIGQLWENEPFAAFPRPRLQLEESAGSKVRISPEWLRHALDLILQNSIQAMTGSLVQELRLTTYKEGNEIHVHLQDTGPGIPGKLRDKLFRERIESDTGLGMGLLMVEAILQTYGGRVFVDWEKTNMDGTNIVIVLPRYIL